MLTIQPSINAIAYRGHAKKQQDGVSLNSVETNQVSKLASDAISNTQKGLINVKHCRLDKTSEASVFFGVDSRENIDKQIYNQMALTILKTKEQNIVNLPAINIDSIKDADSKRNLDYYINNFLKTGIGRWTIRNDKGNTHTIGLIKYDDTIYVLDSLSKYYKDIEVQQEKFANLFKENVVYPNKKQQQADEYTCNNWTHANIDAILKAINEDRFDGENIEDILPDNINEILEEQRDYILENFDGISISGLFLLNNTGHRRKISN